MRKETPKTESTKRKTSGNAAHWRSIFDSIDDQIAVIDRDFRLIYANAAVIRKYGSDKSKVIGRYCYELSHRAHKPCAPPDCACPATEMWNTGETAQTVHLHYHGSRDDLEERYVEVKASPLHDKGNVSGAILVIRDITEAKRMEQRLLEANRKLLALNIIADTVSQSLDLDTILNSALDKVLELMKANTGGILLLNLENETLSYRVYRGLSEEFVNGISGLKLGEGIAGLAAQRKEPIYVDNISQDPRLTRYVVVVEGLRAFASVPLISKGKVLGVMNIASHGLQRFTPEAVQLLGSISNQIAVALENAKLYEELQRKEEMRGELLHLVIATQEEERRRIARGLHDETSQALTSLAVNLEAVADALPLSTEQMKASLKKIQSIALRTLDEIHKVIWQLRPTLLDDLGLVSAVQSHVETNLGEAGVQVHLETLGNERRLPNQVETAIFRIIQEATTNIIRHSDAESACISLDFKETSVFVRIEDDGKGFDLDEAMSATRGGRGLGLLNMRERAELLGGLLKITSQPGKGTQIDLEIPVN